MLFSSPQFFLFFVIYLVFHFLTPRSYRSLLIIVGSTIFYAWWRVEYFWLPFLLIVIAHLGLQWIEIADAEALRKRRLIITIALLFVPLLVFKYADFIYRDVLGPIFGFDRKIVDLPLPLGVSFITFTLTAYVVDIYERKFPINRSATTVTAYVLFFPHLIAGPILRPVELIPQLNRPRPAMSGRFAAGLAIFTVGLVKKLVFADKIAGVVDQTYAMAGPPDAAAALLAIYGFSMQIYCDFSGYTDMAIGIALIIGIRLPNNFLRPYGAESLVDFWRRWHITLSFWLRDYLYIPLGGSRGGARRTSINIIITMVLGGLWHGASWTFVVWGFLHGVGITVVHTVRRAFGKALAIPRWLGILITFHFVTLLWVFFRAPTLQKAIQVLAAPFVGSWEGAATYFSTNRGLLLLLAVFFLLHRLDDHRHIKVVLRRVRPEVVWPAVVVLWVLAITLSQGASVKFIYFDF
jgi:D-alanyl-lipoteichoic acid acyltransferase DltB (MBOAT superfamily)